MGIEKVGPGLWQKVISVIERHRRFVLTSHINPDHDALGSELALAEHLENLGKKAAIINSDPMPKSFRFLDSRRKIKQYSPKRHAPVIGRAEVIIVLDASGSWERVGPVGKLVEQMEAVKVCIDHHPDSDLFVDVAVIRPETAATAELIYSLVRSMNGSVSKQMAQWLYAAIMTDTGNFRFPKTSPQTHRITADLLAAGADPLYIYNQIYEQNSLSSVRLKGHIMDSIQTTARGQIAYYSLAKETLRAYGVRSSELEGFASLGQQVGGVRVTVSCMETVDGRVKISLRSDGSVPINELAAAYGGGGHPSAAGAMVSGKLEEVTAELVEKVKGLLHQTAGQ